MSDPATIRNAFERNAKAVSLRPSTGQSTGQTTVTLREGTTCEIESGEWRFTADVGKASGGNDNGPGPGILERAALGSCLAIGYATWAARYEVPLDAVRVEVETDFDARGSLGVNDDPPGYDAIRYQVYIESPAPESDVRRVIEDADAHSPVLDDFRRPLPVERRIFITTTTEE